MHTYFAVRVWSAILKIAACADLIRCDPLEDESAMLFFTIAFSAAPLTLYVPPIRCLTMFVETMEEMGMEGRVYSRRVFPRARIAWTRLLDCFFSFSSPRRP
ncbi:unnamed protein product [Brassica oleracea var. botrytis]